MKDSTQQPLGQMNRRTMLTTTTALVGGALAGAGKTGFAEEAPKAPRAPASTSPNLDPPVVQIKAGKLRGSPGGQDVLVPRRPVR